MTVYSRDDIKAFYDNPLKRRGYEADHDAADAEHFDRVAERFLAEQEESALLVDFDEPMPPRHKAFWRAVGNVDGKRVLDVGCGYGYSACRLALNGADVVAIDVSGGMCDLTRNAAELNGVEVDVRHVSAVNTGMPDENFDLIVGQVSLHHLPLHTAGQEIRRVLKTGGKAIFLEPVHGTRLALKLRSRLPVPCLESPGGGALRRGEIDALGALFGELDLMYFGVFERLRRFRIFRWASPLLYLIDKFILELPGMHRLASHALIILTKRDN